MINLTYNLVCIMNLKMVARVETLLQQEIKTTEILEKRIK